MIVDSKEQKDFLLLIIQNTPIQGNYPVVSDTIKKMDSLVKAIVEAEIRA